MSSDNYRPLDADFLESHVYLSHSEREELAKLRRYLEACLEPHVAEWRRMYAYPPEVLQSLADLGSTAEPASGQSEPQRSAVFRGFALLEIARVDASVASMIEAHRTSIAGFDVAFLAVGNAIGAYEQTLELIHSLESPECLGAAQRATQLELVRVLGYITSSLQLCVSIAHMRDEGRQGEEHAAIVTLVAVNQCSEAVAWCRDLLTDAGVGNEHLNRHVEDAEASFLRGDVDKVGELLVGRLQDRSGAVV